jgi:hypothetical protein
MQRLWSSEELAERWSLGSEELALLPGIADLGLGSATSFALRTAGNAAIGAAAGVASTAALNKLECTDDSLLDAALTASTAG